MGLLLLLVDGVAGAVGVRRGRDVRLQRARLAAVAPDGGNAHDGKHGQSDDGVRGRIGES
jgi:hypothetical protein